MSAGSWVAPASEWAWVALGCNLGRRATALACLRTRLSGEGAEIAAASTEILTRPVGVTAQPDFHNQVLLLRHAPALAASEWLHRCTQAEEACGRRPTYRWGPRRADADLVLLGRLGEVSSHGGAEVPHPQLPHRAFWHRLIAEIDAAVAAAMVAGARPRPAADPGF